MKIEAKSVEEYIAKTGERGVEIQQLNSFVQKYIPDVPPAPNGGIFYNMISYGLMPYRTKSAKETTEWPLIMIAAQKNYLALYICALDTEGNYIAEKNEKDLGKVSCGKSCIRFKKFDDLNQDTLTRILKDLNLRFKAGEKLFGL